MALAIERPDQETLGALGRQCALLLREGDVDAVAQLFGHAVAFDRPPSLALAVTTSDGEVFACLEQISATA